MDKRMMTDLIVENQDIIEDVRLYPRDVRLEKEGNYVFVGLRRAGKTYIMFQQIKTLVNEGKSVKEILFINFEDERLSEIKLADLSFIIDCYRERYEYRPTIFLDEIQIVDGWEKFVRRLADSGYRVYVTGSNAKMLSNEIATTLGGRFLIQAVYPLSFREFLTAQGFDVGRDVEYGRSKIKLKRQFATYFRYGGLPEIQHFDDKRLWLNSLYQKIFFGDIVARYDIRNTFALKIIIKKIAESVKQPLSFSRLTNVVASTGTKIGKSTVIDYVSYIKETWLVFTVPNIAAKLADKESISKYYFYDNGILSLFLFDPETSLLENLVALTLKRIYDDDLFYFNTNVEVDFYIPSQKWAIQVSYSIADLETLERETTALLKFSRFMESSRLSIITYDEERTIETDGVTIEVVPVWKWLLSCE